MGTSALDDVLGRSQSRKQTALDEVLDTAPSPERVYGSATPAKPITITAQAPSALEQGLATLVPTAVNARRQQDEEGQQIYEQMQKRVAPARPVQTPLSHLQGSIAKKVNELYHPGVIRPTPGMLSRLASKGFEVAEQPLVAASLLGAKAVQGGLNVAENLGVPGTNSLVDELQRFRETAERVTAPRTTMGKIANVASTIGANVAPYMTTPTSGVMGLLAMAGIGGLESASEPLPTAKSILTGAGIGAGFGAAMEAYGPTKRLIANRLNARAEARGLTPGWKIPDQSPNLFTSRQYENSRLLPREPRPTQQYEGAVGPAIPMPGIPQQQFDINRLLPREPIPTTQYQGAVGPAIPMAGVREEISPEVFNARIAQAAEQAPVFGQGEIVPGLAYDARSSQLQSARKRSIAKTEAPLEAARQAALAAQEAVRLRQAGLEASNRALPVVNQDAMATLDAAAAAGEATRKASTASILTPSGFKAYDIGGAVGDAFKQWSRQDATGRAIRGATIAGTGVGLQQSDDATARKIGTALMVGGGTYGLGGFTSENGKAFGDFAERVFAPASRTAETEAMSHIFRANQGDARRAFEQAVAGTKDFAKFLNENRTAGQRMMYIDDIEGGRAFATNRFKQGTGLIREMLDNTRNQIQALDIGKLKTFYEDYFPHIWEDPRSVGQAAQDAIAQATGRRPLGGAKSFLKQRTITDTFSGMFPQGVPENLAQLDEQALRAEVARQGGLMPVTTDPIQLALIKTREMQKFLMDVKSIQDGERQGIVQLVTEPSLAPEGWVRINNPLGTVTGPRNAAGKAVITGEYYAPAPVQQLIDNYLSPGLRGNKAFDMYRTVGNGLNQMQLGLSAFHLGMTSVDAIVSQNALAIEKLASGDIAGALKSAITSPAAPVLNYLKGKQVAEAYLSKAMTGKGYDAIAQAVADAGGAMKQDSFYRGSAPEKMIQAWKQGNTLGAVGNAAIAPFELAARPMMEHIVPMQKLGVFADLAQFELERLPAQATDAERRAVLAKVWDSVDNRMGQLVYDNMFWDRTFKDLAMASVRSVGWGVGTVRELGGAVADVATGKGLTHKVAYAASLPISVGMLGAAYQYLATGQGPQELKDYFYPKTGTFDSNGNPNRVQLPSYIRDVRDYATDVPKTLKHKIHPLLQIGWDWLTNEDYRGDQIYNPDDSYVQNMQQIGSHFLKNASPFGISNLLEQQKRGASIGQQAAGFAGVTAAPRDVQMSRAQQLMSVLTRKGGGGLTPEDAEAQQQRRDALAQLRGGKDANAIDKALLSGALVPKQLEDLMRRAEIDPLQEKFKRLSLRDAMRVYKLGDQREQALWAEALDNKINAALNAGLPIPNP